MGQLNRAGKTLFEWGEFGHSLVLKEYGKTLQEAYKNSMNSSDRAKAMRAMPECAIFELGFRQTIRDSCELPLKLSPRSKRRERNASYSLSVVVVHTESPRHYVTLLRTHKGNDEWLLLDDNNTPTVIDRNRFKTLTSSDACAAVYVKNNSKLWKANSRRPRLTSPKGQELIIFTDGETHKCTTLSVAKTLAANGLRELANGKITWENDPGGDKHLRVKSSRLSSVMLTGWRGVLAVSVRKSSKQRTTPLRLLPNNHPENKVLYYIKGLPQEPSTDIIRSILINVGCKTLVEGAQLE